MVSVARIIPPPSTRREAVHYHAFLTAVMMSRFGQLIKLVAFACWAVTMVLGFFSHIGWLWWILPVRAVLVFVAAFLVLIYRKSYLVVSNKPYPNLMVALTKKLLSREFASAVVVYVMSSFLFFSLVKFQYDIPSKVTLRTYEPKVVNEQYVYINAFAFYIAVCYAVMFILLDYDLVRFPFAPAKSNQSQSQRVTSKIQGNCILALIYSVIATVSFPIVYLMFRKTLWNTAISFIGMTSKLHRSTHYVKFPATFGMLFMCLFTSFLLFSLWEFVNSSFSVYMSLGPSHRGMTISEKSDDPNGTLITGLQATPREYTHTMAFQELCAISLTNAERRVSILQDIERDPEPTIWKQICKESLKVIDTVNKRLEKKPPPAAEEPKKEQPSPLPSKSVLSVKHDNIFAGNGNKETTNTKRVLQNLQDKNAEQSTRAINVVEKLQSVVMTQIEKYSTMATKVLETPLGYPLRCTIERKSVAIIPNPSLVHCAIISLRQFVVNSIQDDQLGLVHRDVSQILTEINKCITLVEEFLNNPPLHWSDVLTKSGKHIPQLTRIHQVHELALDTFEAIVYEYAEQLQELNLSPQVEQRAYQMINSQGTLY